MLSIEKLSYGRTGLGYSTFQDKDFQASSSTATTSKSIIFVKGSQVLDEQSESTSRSNHLEKPNAWSTSNTLNRGKFGGKFVPICHYCSISGHIKPYFFKLRKIQKNGGERKSRKKPKTLGSQVQELSRQINSISLKLGELSEFCLSNKAQRVVMM